LQTADSYIELNSSVHNFDARSKLFMLFFFSVAIFFVGTWPGMAVFCVLFVCAFVASRLHAADIFGHLSAAYILVGFTFVANFFSSTNYLADFSWGVAHVYLAQSALVCMRILLLIWASVLLCRTTTTEQLCAAVASFLRPLARTGLPVDDISMVFSVALRFIPVTAQEFERVKRAQWGRGVTFDKGGVISRARAYAGIFVPMFVGLFRRADKLGLAMEARGYGNPHVQRTRVQTRSLSATEWVVTVALVAVCTLAAVFF
jgi:energy-coupling factor transport system permease protein